MGRTIIFFPIKFFFNKKNCVDLPEEEETLKSIDPLILYSKFFLVANLKSSIRRSILRKSLDFPMKFIQSENSPIDRFFFYSLKMISFQNFQKYKNNK